MKKIDLVTAVMSGIQKTEFQEKLSEKKLSVSKKDATELVELMIDAMQAGFKEDGELDIAGFCTMKIVERAARNGHNPQTGETIVIPAKKAPKCTFKPAFAKWVVE